MAAGVRHELLTRALPALRHEMAAPVSVIRMGVLLLKRQLANVAEVAPDAAAMAERVALIEDQVAALASGVRSLRDWELATHDDGITRSALVAQCTTLMRVAFELNGIGLRLGEGLAPVRARWLERAHPIGSALAAHGTEGLFEGLDADGALLLRRADGRVETIRAGDVFLS